MTTLCRGRAADALAQGVDSAYEVAVRLLDRIERRSPPDDRQRASLLEQLETENFDQTEDIRQSGQIPDDLGAHELIVTVR
jgi:hypothetical protein